MTPTLNPDYQLIYRKEETGQLYFKNTVFGSLVALSEIEYDILGAYVQHGDYTATAAQFAKEFDFEPEFIPQLVSRAEAVDLLLNDDYLVRKQAVAARPDGRLLSQARYLTYKLSQFMAPLHLRLKAEFQGNFRFYRLFAIDFQGSWPDRLCSSRYARGLVLVLSLALLGLALLSLTQTGLAGLQPRHLLNHAPATTAYLLPLLLGGMLISTMLHELAHLLAYRHYGGKTSELGLALLMGMFPVVYVTTNSLYLWNNQRHRLLVTAAGIVVDLGQVLVLAALVLRTTSPTLAFYGVVFGYLALVRALTNVNPFIPGTDGYFLVADALGRPALYQDLTLAALAAWEHIRGGAVGRVTRRQWGAVVYLVASVCWITLYYLLLGLVLLLPLAARLHA